MENRIEIKDEIYVNGEKLQIISGSIHYFRVVPEYWRDRLEKLKAMGCNTVETYVAWNVHEPYEGEFHFEGEYDLCRFMELAQELGLYVILRPSPVYLRRVGVRRIPGMAFNETGNPASLQ